MPPKLRRTIAEYPSLVSTFHPAKNGSLSPEQVSRGSDKKLWWKCPEGPDHEWQANPLHRTRPSGGGCPFCSGKRVSVTNSLATRNPRVAKDWHPAKNAPLTPRDVVAGSERKAWWKCPKGRDHEWCAVIASRGVYGCPFCSGKRISITNVLAARHPALAAEWHPRRNRPLILTAWDITPGSSRKIWWRCRRNPRHVWPSAIHNRLRGNGCPHCRGLGYGPARSLAAKAAEVARMWHLSKNGGLAPADVTAHSARRVWWKCPEGPDHEFQRTIEQQVGNKEKCPFCSNDRVSVTNNLAVRFPRIAREWHPRRNGKLTPRDVVAGTARPFWWLCDSGHEWRTYLPNRTTHGTGCPHCRRRKRRPAMTGKRRERILLPSDMSSTGRSRTKRS